MDNVFAIQYGYGRSREATAIAQYCVMHDSKYRVFKNISDVHKDMIPIGSVEFCEGILGKTIKPDNYPNFLKQYCHREVYESDVIPPNKKLFIKPSDRYKRFTGFISDGETNEDPPYWCSEIVNFVNEWRYYVSYGKVLTGEWYSGDEINVPDAPELDVTFPEDYCGAVDFGVLDNGKIALVEAHHPFACGWYGKDYKIYADWITKGWEYILNQ